MLSVPHESLSMTRISIRLLTDIIRPIAAVLVLVIPEIFNYLVMVQLSLSLEFFFAQVQAVIYATMAVYYLYYRIITYINNKRKNSKEM